MTAFVLGATGFVGREVVRQLCVRGTKTYAHVRPDSKQVADWRARFGELGAEVDTTAWDAAAIAHYDRHDGIATPYAADHSEGSLILAHHGEVAAGDFAQAQTRKGAFQPSAKAGVDADYTVDVTFVSDYDGP